MIKVSINIILILLFLRKKTPPPPHTHTHTHTNVDCTNLTQNSKGKKELSVLVIASSQLAFSAAYFQDSFFLI
jgi:hypothetical protein